MSSYVSKIHADDMLARALALAMSGQMYKDEKGLWHRQGRDYTIDMEARTCTCPAFSKNAAYEAAIEKYTTLLAYETNPLKAQGYAKLLASITEYAGPGCKHISAVDHIEGRIDLMAALKTLPDIPAEGYFVYENGKKVYGPDGKPVLTSPLRYARNIYSHEMANIAKIQAEKERVENPVLKPQDLRVPCVKVTGIGPWRLDVGDRRPHLFWTFAFPKDTDGTLVTDTEALAIAQAIYDPKHYQSAVVYRSPDVAKFLPALIQ